MNPPSRRHPRRRGPRRCFVLAALAVAVTTAAAAGDSAYEAAAAFARQDWATAARLYAAEVEKNPVVEGWTHLARALLHLGDIRGARAALHEALARAPDDPSALLTLALALDQAGDRDGAFAQLDRVAAAGVTPETLQRLPDLAALRSDARFAQVLVRADRRLHACKFDPRHAAFEFWLGQWDVLQDGRLIARETVTDDLVGCALTERWEGVDATHGRSLTYLDPHDRAWRHDWIDAGGTVVHLEGVPEGTGNVHMQGQNTGADGSSRAVRYRWTRLDADHVRRLFERSDDGGRHWVTELDVTLQRATPRNATTDRADGTPEVSSP